MRKFLILLIVVVAALPLSAQWRRGGLYGADVRALIADPRNPDVLYLGTSGGEVYVSRDGAATYPENDPRMPDANAALRILSADLAMVAALSDADVAHSHTWYANFAGHLASLLYGIPHVITAHSLEPLRPWKAEQLAGGYRVSSWAEKTAYEAAAAVIAVSNGMRRDILDCYPAIDPDHVHVVHNGIDTDFYRPVEETDVLDRLGVDRTRP